MLGIGDDAAVWQPSRSHRSVITTDALLEDVHFRRSTMTAADIGWRALASNISDVAAMGATPVLATVALGLPPDFGLRSIRELYEGMLALAADARCAIVGGDITRSDKLSLAITVVGEVRPSNLKLRSGARPGDVLAASGPLGASLAGLMLAEGRVTFSDAALAEEALLAHRRPEPRWREGRFFAASANVHAMMDISDGISTDAGRLAAASGCAVVLDEALPIAACALEAGRSLEGGPAAFALKGGEEFELLVAVEARAFRYLAGRYEATFGRPLLRVGEVREGSGLTMRKGEGFVPITPIGWDHISG